MQSNNLYPSRWPIEHPERLQLYTLNTPNGIKIGIALEELGVPYEAHRIDFGKDDQHDPEYLLINPNNKIPTLVDPVSADGKPLVVFETGAILLYLAEKTGKLMPSDPRLRSETVQWLMFQMAGVGPFFGQFGHFFKFARDKTTDDYGVRRYTAEAKRLLNVLNIRLEGREYLVGNDLTIADIATVPWLDALDFYGGKDHLEYTSYANVVAWVDHCNERPAFQRGAKVGAKPR